MEYGTGVYTGVLPYHSGGNVEPYGTKSRVRSEQPVHFGLMFNVQRLLGDRIGAVVDAMQPGGSGDPFSTLSLQGRQSGGAGKSVSGRGDFGGPRINKKKK